MKIHEERVFLLELTLEEAEALYSELPYLLAVLQNPSQCPIAEATFLDNSNMGELRHVVRILR